MILCFLSSPFVIESETPIRSLICEALVLKRMLFGSKAQRLINYLYSILLFIINRAVLYVYRKFGIMAQLNISLITLSPTRTS